MKYIFAVLGLIVFETSSHAQWSHKWKTLNTGTQKNINAIYFQSPSVGYIVGEDYLFKKTTDGGDTWIDLVAPTNGEKPGNNGNIVGVGYYKRSQFSNVDSGLYLTWGNGYHASVTANDGQTYKPFGYIDSNLFCKISGFSLLPENKGNGYVNMITFGQNCNNKPVYYNYYDGPFSFAHSDSISSASNASFTSVDRDSLTTIFGTSNGYLWRYPWVTTASDSIYLDSSGITSVASASKGTWYASTVNNGRDNMYISVDSGKTFDKDTTFPPSFSYPRINDMSFIAPDTGILAATSNGTKGVIIMRAPWDQWSNWFFVNADQPLKAAKLLRSGVAYVAGEKGLVMRMGEVNAVDTTKDTTNSILKIRSSNVALYPNPTNGIVIVKGLSTLENIAIDVVNMQGKVVAKTKIFDNQIDLSEIPRGTFFIEFYALGDKFSMKILKE